MIDVTEVTGIGAWQTEEKVLSDDEKVQLYRVDEPEGKVFLVVRKKTLEVRCERNLGEKLRLDYESVMESRYFGRGGIEIVPSGQLSEAEIEDLVRLSYNLSSNPMETER